MDKIALNVPGFTGDTNIPNPDGLQFSGPAQTSLGYVISQFLNLTFTLALVLTFIWFVWGAYEYMVAQGQKEALANARNRIKWSVIGFVVLIMAFLVGNYAPQIFPFIRTFYAGQVPQVQPGSQLDSNGNPINTLNNQFNMPQPTAPGQTEF
jgi:hypothetical protein